MKTGTVERFELKDWSEYYVRKSKELLDIETQAPDNMLRIYFKRLLKSLKDPCLVYIILNDLFQGNDPLKGQIEMLQVPIFHKAVMQRGGYRQPWKAIYYQRFVKSEEEELFFEKWISLLEDARTAVPGSRVEVGGEIYPSWEYVADFAEMRLNDAVKVMRKRFKDDGEQEIWEPPRQSVGRIEVNNPILDYVRENRPVTRHLMSNI